MKQYPSIPKIIINKKIYAFDKYDGSSIRAEWSKKRGFYKFGTRTQMLDKHYEHPFLGEAPELIIDKYEKGVSDVMKKKQNGAWGFLF